MKLVLSRSAGYGADSQAVTPAEVTEAERVQGAPGEAATDVAEGMAEKEARTLPMPVVVDEEITMRVLEALTCDKLKALLRPRLQSQRGCRAT